MTLAVLPNFPMVSQLDDHPTDNRPPENARYDCVPASLAAAIMYYDGGVVSPDALKDAEYGETYANAGTSLKRYIDDASDLARAKYHVTCVPYNNTNILTNYVLLTNLILERQVNKLKNCFVYEEIIRQ